MVIRIGKHPKTNPQKTQRELKREREEREVRRGKCWNILQATCKKMLIYIQYVRFLLSYLFFQIFSILFLTLCNVLVARVAVVVAQPEARIARK